MKKVLATALVALMVASTVFAAVTGSANVDFGYNLDSQEYGFLANGTSAKIKLDLHTDEGSKVGEGSVYAGIKGSMKIALEDTTQKAVELKVDEAYVAGENFKVSILGNAGGNDFATSAIDVVDRKPVTYALDYPAAKVRGVNGDIAGYKFGFGLVGNAKAESFATTASFATKPFTLADGLTLKAGVAGSVGLKSEVSNTVGASVEVAFKNDAMSAKVASDMGLTLAKGADNKIDAKFDADVAANFTYAPVDVDLYFVTNAKNFKNLLSAQVATDLASFDVPLTITVTGQDLINTQKLSLALGLKLADIKLNAAVNAGYTVAEKTWSTGANVDYTIDQVGKLYAGFGLEGAKELTSATVKAGLENTTLINNATLSLGYQSANLLAAKNGKQYGVIAASCTIKF